MKKILVLFFVITLLYACNNEAEKASTDAAPAPAPATAEKSTVALPYTATFSTSFNQDLPDAALLNVLNSYKHWETGDMTALAGTFTDTINFDGWDGTHYSGPKAGLLAKWAKSRDSISSVKIEFEVWLKNHETGDRADVITVWYKEYDTYKSGKVDSAQWHDLNGVDKSGKIVWYRQYRRKLVEDKK